MSMELHGIVAVRHACLAREAAGAEPNAGTAKWRLGVGSCVELTQTQSRLKSAHGLPGSASPAEVIASRWAAHMSSSVLDP